MPGEAIPFLWKIALRDDSRAAIALTWVAFQ
jgi:hypothetical protein